MNIYNNLSFGQGLPLSTKVQPATAKPDTVQKTELTDGATTTVKQNYDIAAISEEGRAQALNAAPAQGSSGLFLDAVGKSSEPSRVVIDLTDYEAEAAEEKRQKSLAYDRAWESWDAMLKEGMNGSISLSSCIYDPTTGLYKFNFSAANRAVQTRHWAWQENLRVNDPEAYEAWVSEHGVMKEPKFSGSTEGDVYQLIALTPDAEGKTELDRFHMLFQQMKDQAALIEAQFRENRKNEEEESGEPSAAQRLETQNVKLEEDLQTNGPEVPEIRLDMLDDRDPQ